MELPGPGPSADEEAALAAIARLVSDGGVGVISVALTRERVNYLFEAIRRAGLGVDWRLTRLMWAVCEGKGTVLDNYIFVRRGMPHLGTDSREDAQAHLRSAGYQRQQQDLGRQYPPPTTSATVTCCWRRRACRPRPRSSGCGWSSGEAGSGSNAPCRTGAGVTKCVPWRGSASCLTWSTRGGSGGWDRLPPIAAPPPGAVHRLLPPAPGAVMLAGPAEDRLRQRPPFVRPSTPRSPPRRPGRSNNTTSRQGKARRPPSSSTPTAAPPARLNQAGGVFCKSQVGGEGEGRDLAGGDR
jgi:hypothetical protein